MLSFATGLGSQTTRREWLRISGWGALTACGATPRAGLGDGNARPTSLPGFGRAKSVILIYASGGQSQLDMWDPKPNAPADVRSEFAPISTSVPGVAFCEHLPRVARLANRFTLVRSMSHEDLDHGSATYLALTGRYHKRLSSNPDPHPDDFPTYGAVLKRLRARRSLMFPAVHVNGPALVPFTPSPGQNGGFLGREFEPLVVGDVSRRPVAVPGLGRRNNVSGSRLQRRIKLKDAFDAHAAQLDASRLALDMDLQYRDAYELLTTPRCRDAFDLGAEPPALRDRYGRHRSGQACLLARRLVEAGVPLITVIWNHSNRGQDEYPQTTEQYGWDTHNDIFYALKRHLLPRFDESFSALMEDLDQRGLLEDTLVVCMGEFGRAPRIALEPNFAGKTPGRKHWSRVYSIAIAGAGVSRGGLVGASDRLGGEPRGEYFGPWDICATMYSALGVDPRGHFLDSLQRPHPVCIGRPLEPIYAG